MAKDLAIVTFHGQPAAASAFAVLRARSGDAAWTHEAALVEHHRHKDQLVLHGTVAGHYVSVDEADHLSQPGAAKGALVGGLIGILFLGGPVGLAPGLVLGAAVGAGNGRPDEVEASAGALGEQLRAAVPRGSSAIVVLADSSHTDELLAILDASDGEVTRRTLSGAELEVIESAVAAAPLASAGPRLDGDAPPGGEITAA